MGQEPGPVKNSKGAADEGNLAVLLLLLRRELGVTEREALYDWSYEQFFLYVETMPRVLGVLSGLPSREEKEEETPRASDFKKAGISLGR